MPRRASSATAVALPPPPAPASPLAAWRQQRRQRRTLPSGLPVVLQRCTVLDVAARGNIPLPILGQMEAIITAAEQGSTPAVSLATYAEYAGAINLVVQACMVDPPVADEPSATHVGINELPISDRIDIFEWAHEEAAHLATFSEPAG
jgi:hypothetical protein